MVDITAAQVFRDFETDGVPASVHTTQEKLTSGGGDPRLRR